MSSKYLNQSIPQQNINIKCNQLQAQETNQPEPTLVTQSTSTTTPVTCNGLQGRITTFSQTLVQGTRVNFTVNNSSVESGDLILSSTSNYSGSGFPCSLVGKVANGSFELCIMNKDNVSSLDSPCDVEFKVIKFS